MESHFEVSEAYRDYVHAASRVHQHEQIPLFNTELEVVQLRFYMVGKLYRQERERPDPGYRSALLCPCHSLFAKVFGPRVGTSAARYCALCPVTSEQLAEAPFMEELWLRVSAMHQQG